MRIIASCLLVLCVTACASARLAPSPDYDLVIRNGRVIDGSGTPAQTADVAVRDGRIVAWLPAGEQAHTRENFDARGQVVAPGFINMLSWANDALMVDPRGMSDVLQGVTLEVFGEGSSPAPVNAAMKAEQLRAQGDLKHAIPWTSLDDYFQHVHRRVTPNIATFVGATTVRQHAMGNAARAATPAEISKMQDIVREAMRDGALGVGSSLIYEPATNATTEELIALSRAAGERGGGYISHIRDESDKLLESIDELITIGKQAGVRAEAYHLKASGVPNWPKMSQAIARLQAARDAGQDVGANMYTYPASSTGLDTILPKWVREGGAEARDARLDDPAQYTRAIADTRKDYPAGGAKHAQLGRTLLVSFQTPALKPFAGKTLTEVAQSEGHDLIETAVSLIARDNSRVGVVFFTMSEDNVKLGLSQPWISLGSDGSAQAAEGVFLESSTHPRAYGNFARMLGHYVRDEQLVSLEQAVHRITGMPAHDWKLKDRGCLAVGCHADIVVFDPATIRDNATFAQPQRYATGVSDVWINGVRVVREGQHTGATPGQAVRGPGYVPRP